MPNRRVIGGCLVVGGLPFVAGAIAMFVWAVSKASEGDLGSAAGLAIGGLIVGAIPLSFALAFFLVGQAHAAQARKQRIRSEDPQQPWRWRREWKEGRVEFRVPAVARIVLWGFAVAWNGLILLIGAVILLQPQPSAQRAGVLAFLALFLAAGLFLVVLAWRASAQHRRFGDSTFEMARIPFALGGRVEGWVRAPAGLRSASAVRLTLDCVDVPRDSDLSDRVLWRDQVTVPLSAIDFGPAQTRIPVSLGVPGDQRASNDVDLPGAHVEWRVSVEADLPGVDYRAVFDVPVFPSTVEKIPGPGAFPVPALAGAAPASAEAARPPARFRVEPLPDGTAIQFASPGWFLWWTIGPLLLLPAAALATSLPALREVPAWMVMVGAAGVTGFLLAIALFGVVTQPNRLEVRPDRVVVRRGVYGVGWDRTIPTSAVTEIVREPTTNGPRVDWNVEIKAGGTSYNAALALHDLDEAKWLAAELTRLIAGRDARRGRVLSAQPS